jgi:hypothetical protein
MVEERGYIGEERCYMMHRFQYPRAFVGGRGGSVQVKVHWNLCQEGHLRSVSPMQAELEKAARGTRGACGHIFQN